MGGEDSTRLASKVGIPGFSVARRKDRVWMLWTSLVHLMDAYEVLSYRKGWDFVVLLEHESRSFSSTKF